MYLVVVSTLEPRGNVTKYHFINWEIMGVSEIQPKPLWWLRPPASHGSPVWLLPIHATRMSVHVTCCMSVHRGCAALER